VKTVIVVLVDPIENRVGHRLGNLFLVTEVQDQTMKDIALHAVHGDFASFVDRSNLVRNTLKTAAHPPPVPSQQIAYYLLPRLVDRRFVLRRRCRRIKVLGGPCREHRQHSFVDSGYGGIVPNGF